MIQNEWLKDFRNMKRRKRRVRLRRYQERYHVQGAVDFARFGWWTNDDIRSLRSDDMKHLS